MKLVKIFVVAKSCLIHYFDIVFMKKQGLWIGLICGMFCQSSSLLLMTIFRKWIKLNAATV